MSSGVHTTELITTSLVFIIITGIGSVSTHHGLRVASTIMAVHMITWFIDVTNNADYSPLKYWGYREGRSLLPNRFSRIKGRIEVYTSRMLVYTN